MKELAKVYDPKLVEDATYDFWLDGGYFHTKRDPDKLPYTIVMPPPNITGQLHMGHAMDNTWQDILIRYKRMQGFAALWVPGTDHASIATEARIVAGMKEEGLTKDDIGRDKFLERAWEWKRQYGGRIVEQLKKLGSSCDWQRERFTMDEGCSFAVRTVFKRLFDEGLIYRGERIVNWCPHCLTSISDAEVEHEEREGKLYYIKYPIVGEDGFVMIATTRPETMLGDVAVAIHPEDRRFRKLQGKKVVLPLVNREIPVVCDSYVEQEFGTGVVKITPAHDPNDFEVGRRHDLPILNVFTPDGHINAEGGKYEGMDLAAARKAVLADLEAEGLLVKTEPRPHNVGTCYRCGTTVEPMVSMQWFVAMEPLATPAIAAVKDDTIRYVPERFTKTYLHWMEGSRDWCISRQLWWGHRIPAWHCDTCGRITVSVEPPQECEHCHSHDIRQDEDTLDTWFSSALWPFSTLGWPEDTEDLAYFYPTSTLVTAYDIIGFWVSRMIFSGLHFMEKAPFDTVLIHGLIRDEQGRKMSKSLGNGIDPLEIIDEYGADALRFMLVTGSTPGNDMRFSYEKVRAARNFANKLWNAARFVLMNLPADFEPGLPAPDSLELSDKWAISRLNSVVQDVTDNIEKFEVGLASQKIQDFIWDVLCDWSIEICKTRFNCDDKMSAEIARCVLVWLLTTSLKLLHPFMPFITEEIYRALPGSGEALIAESWPRYNPSLNFAEEERDFGDVIEFVRAVRAVRAEMNVHPAKHTHITVETARRAAFKAGLSTILKLASADDVRIVEQFDGDAAGMVQVATQAARGFIPLSELVDLDKERARLEKEKTAAENEVKSLAARLENKGFVEKAPANVVEDIRGKLKNAEEKAARLAESLAALG